MSILQYGILFLLSLLVKANTVIKVDVLISINVFSHILIPPNNVFYNNIGMLCLICIALCLALPVSG